MCEKLLQCVSSSSFAMQCKFVHDLVVVEYHAYFSEKATVMCILLQDLEGLRGLNLTDLEMIDSSMNGRGLVHLKGMPLAKLDLARWNNLQSVRPLQGLPLTSLDLLLCTNLDSLLGLEGMPLTALALDGCMNLKETAFEALRFLPLMDLNVSSGEQNFTGKSLKALEGMRTLTCLNIGRCFLIEDSDLEYLKGLPLISLNIEECDGIDGSGLQYIKDIPLQKLNISRTKIRSLHLKACELWGSTITEFEARGCREFELEGVSSLHNMTLLDWAHRVAVANDNNPLEYIQGKPLTFLDLSWNRFLKDEWLDRVH